MTPQSIERRIRSVFRSLYPTALSITVRGAGEEELQVTVQPSTAYLHTFVAEVPSDDDGYFRFYQVDRESQLEDASCFIAVAYPED